MKASPTVRWPALVIGALAALAILAYAFIEDAGPRVAPPVLFTTVQGELIMPRDLYGKVVLINFWSTSCEVCMHEMPKLVDTFRKYRPLGLETVAVAMSYDRPDFVLRYAEDRGLPFKVALDVQGDAASQYGNVQATPTTFVIDKHGNILKRYVGEPDFAELGRILEKALAESA
jgi:peroxiredoxin